MCKTDLRAHDIPKTVVAMLFALALTAHGLYAQDGRDDAPAAQSPDAARVGINAPKVSPEGLLRLRGELALSGEQIQRIAQIAHDANKRNAPLLHAHQALKLQRRRLSRASDAGERHRIRDEIRALRRRIHANRADSRARAHRVLTRGQQARLDWIATR